MPLTHPTPGRTPYSLTSSRNREDDLVFLFAEFLDPEVEDPQREPPGSPWRVSRKRVGGGGGVGEGVGGAERGRGGEPGAPRFLPTSGGGVSEPASLAAPRAPALSVEIPNPDP